MKRELQSKVATINELATLLIPVRGKLLVLPNVSVAEVIPYEAPIRDNDYPNWFLGKFRWRNTDVPLVSFESINEEPFSSNNKNRRIAVLNGLDGDSRLPFSGILIDGMPRLMRVLSDEIVVDDQSETGPAELACVFVNGEQAVIPNVEFIQQEIVKLL